MSEELKQICKEASDALGFLEEGSVYPANYVVARFQEASERYPKDALIGHMRDVLIKTCSKELFVSQKQVGELYDQLYSIGGKSSFRYILGDLLPETKTLKKQAHPNSALRVPTEKQIQPVGHNKDLADAFSVLFSLGNHDSSFSAFAPGRDDSLKKAVIGKLSVLGYTPTGVDVVTCNDHFALCSANYTTQSMKKVSALIPVQISNGVTKEPNLLVQDDKVIELNGRNLYVHIREQERLAQTNEHLRVASGREDGKGYIETKKVALPEGLEEFADLDNRLVAAASSFTFDQIGVARDMLSSELLSFGAWSADITVGDSDEGSLIFDVHVPTKLGKTLMQVPVEIVNGQPLLPERFVAEAADQKVYDFNKSGFEKFMFNLSEGDKTLTLSRQTGDMSRMTYAQLKDQIIEGVSSKDYRLAEDALCTIQEKFGGEHYKGAFEYYTNLMKHSQNRTDERGKQIKEAYRRGDLIKTSTSVELWCPKLAMPVSKVDFDGRGRPIPKYRSKMNNQSEGVSISTAKIHLT